MGRAPTDSKKKLIETAAELIWHNSYGAISVDDICKASGVKKGSFYHYFPSKAKLAIAAMEACYEESRPIYNEIFSPALPAKQRFEKLAQHVYEEQLASLREHGRVYGCPYASLGSELAGQDEDIRLEIESIFHHYLMYYQNALRDLMAQGDIPKDTKVEEKAEEVYAYILGQITIARIRNNLDFLGKNLKSGIFAIIGIKET